MFFKYLKSKLPLIALFILFAVLFAVIFALYSLPPGAVLYPSLMCAVLGICVLMIDFIKVRKLHTELCRIKKMNAFMIDTLPEARTLTEADYREIMENLCEQTRQLQSIESARFAEMTDYYTVWAHQIKTPIASMKLTLQNEDSRLSRQMRTDLLRTEQYVEMVLAYLRLDSESNDYVFAEYSLDAIIKSSVKKFASEFIYRKINLEYEPIDKKLITDEKWFGFIIEQLISNALKYTKNGSIKIYMHAPEILAISDTGIGIAKEDLPRVFEKGYTGYNGRTDKSASGIGLYLCKRICKNLGISISIESEAGKGTVVFLNISQYKSINE